MSEQRDRRTTSSSRTRRDSSSSPSTQKRQPRKKKKRKRKGKGGTFLKILIALVIIIGFGVTGAILGVVFGIIQDTDVLNTSDVTPESYTSLIYDADGNEFDKLHGEENREYVQLENISLHLKNAVVAIEDERFYEHNGIDMRGIFRAMVENIKTMSFSQGASTITQQLIKNEVLEVGKTWERKIKEQYLAISLEKSLETQLGSKKAAKDYILELYLNTFSLDHGLRGIEAASQYYFGKNASELNLAESACIAGITQSPSRFAPDTNPENNKARQTLVLGNMLRLGYITQAEYDAALAEDVYANLVGKKAYTEEIGTANHNYFVEAMIDQVATDLMEQKNYTRAQAYNLIYSGGLSIHSTMDTRMQSAMESAFMDDSLFPASDGTYDVTYLISVLDTETDKQSHYERNKTISDVSQVDAFVESVKAELLDSTHTLVLDNVTVSRSLQAAMVIMDHHTGEVKAVVGGRGQKPGDSVFNRATQGLRQQGSTMKPLASYLPAIELGLLMPGSIIVDEPVTYGTWSPRNWNGKFLGPTTVRKGIRDSMNVLAVKAYLMVGAETSHKYLEQLGLSTLVDADKAATTALGGLTNGVSVLEQTAAYATIANNGVYNEPRYYSVIYDHDGNVLLDNSHLATRRVIKETTSYLLTSMLKDAINGGGNATGGKAALSNMTIAGKTGTTNDTVDLTFYGYTPYYTAGIWMGYDTSKVIENANNAHLVIWRTVMQKVHEGLANKDFTQPSGIVKQTYCSATGDIPSELCAHDYYGLTTHTDIAASNFTGLKETCTTHKTFIVCTETGKLATDHCKSSGHSMEVVLAVGSNGSIYGKPSTIPEGKMDINVSENCPETHDNIEDVIPEPGETVSPEEGEDIIVTPEDNFWGDDENFGIN